MARRRNRALWSAERVTFIELFQYRRWVRHMEDGYPLGPSELFQRWYDAGFRVELPSKSGLSGDEWEQACRDDLLRRLRAAGGVPRRSPNG